MIDDESNTRTNSSDLKTSAFITTLENRFQSIFNCGWQLTHAQYHLVDSFCHNIHLAPALLYADRLHRHKNWAEHRQCARMPKDTSDDKIISRGQCADYSGAWMAEVYFGLKATRKRCLLTMSSSEYTSVTGFFIFFSWTILNKCNFCHVLEKI